MIRREKTVNRLFLFSAFPDSPPNSDVKIRKIGANSVSNMTNQSEGLSALHQIIEGSNVSKAQLKHLLHQFVDKFCIDEKTVAVGQELLDATRDLTIEKVSQVADPKAGKKKKEIQFDR